MTGDQCHLMISTKLDQMKSLHLVRHAKSSWEYPTLDDFDRPLNTRGEKTQMN
jgi:hypothetical protein